MSVICKNKKTAIVLFNLGGPDSLDAVQPFLFNLFNDPAIIGVPRLIRYFLARYISKKRAPIAQDIYREIGDKSPIFDNTKAQADALLAVLETHGDVKTFICMRYWHPMSDEVVQEVKDYHPDQIILLPLYPQFSTTTSGSSFTDWQHAALSAGLKVPTSTICCYPTEPGFVKSQAEMIWQRYKEAEKFGKPRILFSAHGLPEKIIHAGDPYQKEVEASTQAVVKELSVDNLDYVNCYQSRVGPLKWIGPSTEDEIARAGADGAPVVLVPIAFVSEHSETLVELDIEYKHLANKKGVTTYLRVPTVSAHPDFIQGLANLCLSVTDKGFMCPWEDGLQCVKDETITTPKIQPAEVKQVA